MTNNSPNRDVDEELAELTRLVKDSVKARQSRRPLGPITPREAAALLAYVDYLETASEKRTEHVTDKDDREIDYDENDLRSALTKLIEIGSTPDSAVVKGRSPKE